MEFRTKREAEEAATKEEHLAETCGAYAGALDAYDPARLLWRRDATQHRAEAARIRALLPTLPEQHGPDGPRRPLTPHCENPPEIATQLLGASVRYFLCTRCRVTPA
jgi:hypothetical protein